MDIYPVICFKVDEHGSAVEVLETTTPALPVKDTFPEVSDTKDTVLKREDASPERSESDETDLALSETCSQPVKPAEGEDETSESTSSEQKCLTGFEEVDDDKKGPSADAPSNSSPASETTQSHLTAQEAESLGEPKRCVSEKDIDAVKSRVKSIGCLYKCISQGIFGHTNGHALVRHNIVNNIVNNWSHHKDYATRNSKFYMCQIDDKNDYLNFMSRDNVQGGYLELRVATAIFNVYIDLINAKDKTIQRYGSCLNMKKKILLYYRPETRSYDFIEKDTTQTLETTDRKSAFNRKSVSVKTKPQLSSGYHKRRKTEFQSYQS